MPFNHFLYHWKCVLRQVFLSGSSTFCTNRSPFVRYIFDLDKKKQQQLKPCARIQMQLKVQMIESEGQTER